MSALAVVEKIVYEMEEAFSRALTEPSLNFKAEAEFALQIISKSDYAVRIASQNPQSVRDAVTNVAAIGISLNPAKRQAYLVPMDGAIQLQISWMGLIEMAVASGSVMWAKAEIVHEKDTFALNGFDRPPTHSYAPFSTDRGSIIGVYCVAKLHSGDYLTETMTLAQVHEIRDRTSAWKAWVKDKKKCPWVTDEEEMVRKTAIKRAFKTWPRTDRLDRAIHHLNTEGGEGLSPIQAAPVENWVDVSLLIDAARATKTDADALAYWKANNGKLAKQPTDHAALKKAVTDHRQAMRDAERTIDEDKTT